MKILICPLNWGLGHATRCIPVIKQLIQEGHEVVIAADGYPLHLLRETFSEIRFIESTSYKIRYSAGKSQLTAMFKSIPKILIGTIKEHYWLKQLNKQEQFDQIISDNRFGLWNKNIHSIYITHQLMIKMPLVLKFMEPLVWLGHRFFIHRYNECWVPDDAGENNLSGDLSHRYTLPRNVRFIGPLSRFSALNTRTTNLKSYDTVILISGPEPQRTLFEKQMIERFSPSTKEVLIVQGLPGQITTQAVSDSLKRIPHLTTEVMAFYLLQAKIIICRSGYSTIMDLVALGCLDKAILIPTPGQTEQEYLAHYLYKRTAGKLPTVFVN